MKKLSILLIVAMMAMTLMPSVMAETATEDAETTVFGIVAFVDGPYVGIQLSNGMFPFIIDSEILTMHDQEAEAEEEALGGFAIGEILKLTYTGDVYADILTAAAAVLYAPDAVGVVTAVTDKSIVIAEDSGSVELATDGAAVLSDHGIIVGDIVEIYGDEGVAHAICVDTKLVNGVVSQVTDKTVSLKFGSRDIVFDLADVTISGTVAEGNFASVLYIGDLSMFYAATTIIGFEQPASVSASLFGAGQLVPMSHSLIKPGKLVQMARVKTHTVMGVITDGTNAGITIRTSSGRSYHINKDNSTRVTGPGLSIGNKATVTYTGTLSGGNAKAKVIKTAHLPAPEPVNVKKTAYGYVNATGTNWIQVTIGSYTISYDTYFTDYQYGDSVRVVYTGNLYDNPNIISVSRAYMY